MVVSEVEDATDCGGNGADDIGAAAAVLKYFAADAILLVGEGVGDVGGCL
jgi:hypothetical protein